MNIQAIYGLTNVKPYKNSKIKDIPAKHSTLLYGVELEIESASPGWLVSGMDVTTDGSLRNNGGAS